MMSDRLPAPRPAPWLMFALVLLAATPPVFAEKDVALSSDSAAGTSASSETWENITNLMIPMRDGVNLATDIYFPRRSSGPLPIVLMRTPYNKSGQFGQMAGRYSSAGYIFAAQDCRGKFESEGEYRPFQNDMEDGYDTIEWLAKQAWSNGKIGITGPSAMGITGNLAAASNPPHLVAAYVVVAPQSMLYESSFIGGVFKDADVGGWMRSQEAGHLVPEIKSRVVMDDLWTTYDFIFHRHKVNVPVYNVGGWYDIFTQGGVGNFEFLQNHGRPGARGRQKLLMGPFGHGNLKGDLRYRGDMGIVGALKEEMKWWDYWLKGEENGIMDDPPVKYYMMASAKEGEFSKKNGYVDAENWPPLSRPVRFYLQPDFGLSTVHPQDESASATYIFDPNDPVETVGGANLRLPLGPMDQRKIKERPDYLRFVSEPLKEDVAVAGKIDFELFASTDAPDTDFMVKLVDVYPDGYEALVLDSAVRTRYRKGRTAEEIEMMTPGKIERMNVDMWSTAITFEAGHRIAVHITSSNAPRFEVNPNTGIPPGEEIKDMRIAKNTIHFDPLHPSAMILPVISERRID